jgi:hypothetical protein
MIYATLEMCACGEGDTSLPIAGSCSSSLEPSVIGGHCTHLQAMARVTAKLAYVISPWMIRMQPGARRRPPMTPCLYNVEGPPGIKQPGGPFDVKPEMRLARVATCRASYTMLSAPGRSGASLRRLRPAASLCRHPCAGMHPCSRILAASLRFFSSSSRNRFSQHARVPSIPQLHDVTSARLR